jgi:hypothetical protein
MRRKHLSHDHTRPASTRHTACNLRRQRQELFRHQPLLEEIGQLSAVRLPPIRAWRNLQISLQIARAAICAPLRPIARISTKSGTLCWANRFAPAIVVTIITCARPDENIGSRRSSDPLPLTMTLIGGADLPR